MRDLSGKKRNLATDVDYELNGRRSQSVADPPFGNGWAPAQAPLRLEPPPPHMARHQALHPRHRSPVAGEEEAVEAPSVERRLKIRLFRGRDLVGFV